MRSIIGKEVWIDEIRRWPVQTIIGFVLGAVVTWLIRHFGVPTLDQLAWPLTGLGYAIIFFSSSFLFFLLFGLARWATGGLTLPPWAALIGIRPQIRASVESELKCTDLQIWDDGGEQYVRVQIHNASLSEGLKGLTGTLERTSDSAGAYELGEMLDESGERRKLNTPIQLFTQERLKERLQGGDKFVRPFDMRPGQRKFLEIFQVTNPIVRCFHVYDAGTRHDLIVPEDAQFDCAVHEGGQPLSFTVKYESLDDSFRYGRRGYSASLVDSSGSVVATREFYEEN